jgi:hypothetical protein
LATAAKNFIEKKGGKVEERGRGGILVCKQWRMIGCGDVSFNVLPDRRTLGDNQSSIPQNDPSAATV